MASLIRVTLKRSTSKCTPRQVATLKGLGLPSRGKVKVLKDTAPVRGMILKMQHMLDVERFDGADTERKGARVRARAAAKAAPAKAAAKA